MMSSFGRSPAVMVAMARWRVQHGEAGRPQDELDWQVGPSATCMVSVEEEDAVRRVERRKMAAGYIIV